MSAMSVHAYLCVYSRVVPSFCLCLAALCGYQAVAGTRLKGGIAGEANVTVPAVHLYRQVALLNATAPNPNRTAPNQTLSNNGGGWQGLQPSPQRLSNITNISRGHNGSGFHRSKHFRSAPRGGHAASREVSGSRAYQSSFKPSGRRLQSLPGPDAGQTSYDASRVSSDSARTLNPRQRRTRACHQQEREERAFIAVPVSSEQQRLPGLQPLSPPIPAVPVAVHSRPSRSTQQSQPIIYVGNNNISLIGNNPKAHIHQLEPLDFSPPHIQQQLPFYNEGTPYEGVFRSNGHPITGINITRVGPAGLFGYVNNSDIDVVADNPHYRGNPSGLVARAESNNKISLTIRDGQAGCSSTNGSEPCVSGLAVGVVTGDSNRIEQRNSFGKVAVNTSGNSTHLPPRVIDGASGHGSQGVGALGIGQMSGSHNTFIQRRTQGEVSVNTRGAGIGRPSPGVPGSSLGRTGAGVGSQATAALGIGHWSGVNNTIDQQRVNGTLELLAVGDGVSGGSGVSEGSGGNFLVDSGIGRGSTAYLGGGAGRSEASNSTVTQRDITVSMTAQVFGNGLAAQQFPPPSDGDYLIVRGGSGRACAVYAGGAIGRNVGTDNSVIQQGVVSDIEAGVQGNGTGGNGIFVGGSGIGPEVLVAYGIGADAGRDIAVRQVGVNGSLSLSAQGEGTGGLGIIPDDPSVTNGSSLPSRTLAAQAVAALQGDNARLLLLAGGNKSYPAVNLDGGSCNPEGIIDVAAYRANGVGCDIRQLNSTHPEEWRAAYNQSCPDGDSNSNSDNRNNSCHAPYEQFQSLVPQGQQALLLTRQGYADGQYDGLGVFRIARLNKRNGTFPGVDQGFGNDSYLLYAAQDNTTALEPGLQPVSQVVAGNGSHLLSLYRPTGGGAQLASFPVNRSGDELYRTALFPEVTGTPLLLGDNGWSIWSQDGNSSLIRYRLDTQGIKSSQSYNLLNSIYGGYPLLTAGIDDNWLYIARTLAQSRQVVVERMYIETGVFDSWQATLDNITVNADIPYTMNFTGGQIVLLPRGEIQLPVSNASDASPYNQQIQLDPYGGDAHWCLAQALVIEQDQPVTSVSMVVAPASSTPVPVSTPAIVSSTSISAEDSSTAMPDGVALTSIAAEGFTSIPAGVPLTSIAAEDFSISESAATTTPAVSLSAEPVRIPNRATSSTLTSLSDNQSGQAPLNPTPSDLPPVADSRARILTISLGVGTGLVVVVTTTVTGTVVCYCVKTRHNKRKRTYRISESFAQASNGAGIAMTGSGFRMVPRRP